MVALFMHQRKIQALPMEQLFATLAALITRKIKDAVCDKIRHHSGRRPNVDTRAPDVPIRGHLTEREFTLAGRPCRPINLTGFLL